MSATSISLFYTHMFHYCSEFSKKIKNLLWSEGELKHMLVSGLFYLQYFWLLHQCDFFICKFLLCLCVI